VAADPVLTIRRAFPRPPREVLSAFESVTTSMICDAQKRSGGLHHAVKPVTSRRRFVGPALTVSAGPKDNLASYAALKIAKPGDVIVIADEDGVVVVPLSSVGRVLPILEKVKASEAEMSALVRDGHAAPPWLEGILSGPGVEWL